LQAIDDDGHEATRAPKAKPTLDAEKFSKALKAIQEGRYSIDELKVTYNLSKEQEGQL
jgi:anti-sigma28 factor (negative regulator of flagellin synthesis)